MRPVADQTILVTGATDGLGQAVATELAGTGATVLLHGRDDRKGKQAVREIQHQTGNSDLFWYRADLSSLSEAAELAARISRACGQLDALVNSAGVGMTTPGGGRRMMSRDGYELRFAVNYLAPYVLTRKLAPLLRASAPARVVNVTSTGQEPIDFGDVMLERSYDGTRAYQQSKLALIMFTFDLAAELAGTGVTVNCLHPATYLPTKLVKGHAEPRGSLTDGVRATMRLIVSPALENVTGRYYDGLLEGRAIDQAYDQDARQRLHKMSDQLTRLDSDN
jgi:NAD(P)-dependent dehydrogenase (short-subunit alcohol dehydrogenase family)